VVWKVWRMWVARACEFEGMWSCQWRRSSRRRMRGARRREEGDEDEEAEVACQSL